MVDLPHSELYRNIPVGDKVAREFPWWLEGTVVMPAGAAGRQRRFSVGAPATYFRSDREGPIKVREVRLILDNTSERVTAGELSTSVQIKHSKYDVMDRWLPALCLNTEDNRHFWGDTASARMQLCSMTENARRWSGSVINRNRCRSDGSASQRERSGSRPIGP